MNNENKQTKLLKRLAKACEDTEFKDSSVDAVVKNAIGYIALIKDEKSAMSALLREAEIKQRILFKMFLKVSETAKVETAKEMYNIMTSDEFVAFIDPAIAKEIVEKFGVKVLP